MASARKKPKRVGGAATQYTAWQIAFDNADRIESVRIYADGSAWVELEGNDDPPPFGPSEEYRAELPEKLEWINQQLDEAGWPPMSSWWKKRLARFYFANWIAREKLCDPKRQRRRCLWRVGRRGGKSSTICRVAVYECEFGDHDVPPGDTGVYAIISAEKDQAKERIVTIIAICKVLGIAGKGYTTSFEFAGERNRAIRCFTASITAVVSFTCIGALCDEEAIWRDTETGMNPAKDIIRSLTPTIASMPNAVIHHMSAPWSTLDEHYKMFELGNTAAQLAFYAPTWVANDDFITEEETHLLEPDEPSWERAYKAIPLASDETKFFSAALIDEARAWSPEGYDDGEEEDEGEDETGYSDGEEEDGEECPGCGQAPCACEEDED